MNAILKYPGSKWLIANWIIGHFPENYEKMVYLEPFVGSGAVFFNKRPGTVETINDLDSDIVNLFHVLREYPNELYRAIELTPYSREEYNHSFDPCEDSIEKARRYMIKTSQTISAKPKRKSSWTNYKQLKIGGALNRWNKITKVLEEITKRLRGDSTHLVQIEHMNAFKLIERYDSPDVLIYLDPPYVMSSRKSGALYRFEMDDAEHEQLLELVKKSRAKIILSGYENDLYNSALRDWHKDSTMSQTTSHGTAKEMIWMNYEPPFEQLSL